MNVSNIKALYISFAVAAMTMVTSAQAQQIAPSVGDMANNIAVSFSSVGNAVQSFCWVMAFVTAGAAAFKFAAYAREPDREKISTPFMLLGVAALFFAIPMVIGTSVATLYGTAPVQQSTHLVSP